VVRRENAALTHEAYTSIQPDESPPGAANYDFFYLTIIMIIIMTFRCGYYTARLLRVTFTVEMGFHSSSSSLRIYTSWIYSVVVTSQSKQEVPAAPVSPLPQVPGCSLQV